MSELEPEIDTAEEDEDQDLPSVDAMTLKEIEEDFEYLFDRHVGHTVFLFWTVVTAVAMFVLLFNKASTVSGLIVLGAVFISLVITFIIAKVAVIQHLTKSPNSNLKYRYVWIFSLIFNGPQGQAMVRMSHERIEEMFRRRCKLLERQSIAGYSPVNTGSDRKWNMLGRILLEKLPLGIARTIHSYYLLLFFVMVVMGIVGIVQVVIFIGEEFLLWR